MEESNTIKDLKELLEDETGFVPSRQELYFMGCLLDSNFDDELIQDFIEPFAIDLIDVEFTLVLPKASSASNEEKKWLIIGKPNKFKTIMLMPNMEEDLTNHLPLKNNRLGISYAVEGSLSKQNRKFSVQVYEVSKSAKKIRITTDDNFDAKVFQTLENKEDEEEIKGSLEVFDEAMIDREKKLDKAVKVAKIGCYTAKGVSAIIGAILGTIGLHVHLNPTSEN